MQGQNPSLSARYYNSDLSIWISVDPLVDKYPNLSPYTYCADNPVKVVDEDGRDIWEVDEDGNIAWKSHSAKHQLFAVDKNGNRTGKSISMKNDDIVSALSQGTKTVLNGFDG